MRTIVGQLTPELQEVVGKQQVAKADALKVVTFRSLMEHVARLSYANKDYLLFFRGQATDYKNKAGASSFYPSIYRGERLTQAELESRFAILASTSKRLYEAFQKEKIEGASEVRRRKHIQWSILQHYEVCATPLLDFTQSVRVACSFALLGEGAEDPYVFAFGLPYVTNRVSVNSEHDLVNVRLLSICPPDALRPFFQEGYVVGTDEITTDYPSKDELDFNGRLIAKFQIPRTSSFWGKGFEPMPLRSLYPTGDKIFALCKEIQVDIETGVAPGQLGLFLQVWANLEGRLLTLARSRKERVFSVVDAIRVLERAQLLPANVVERLHSVRRIRNLAVHHSDQLAPDALAVALTEINALQELLKQIASKQP